MMKSEEENEWAEKEIIRERLNMKLYTFFDSLGRKIAWGPP